MLAFLGLFLHDSLQRLNALKGLLSLIINLIAALFFVIFGPVAWLPVLIMAVSSMAGGNLGVYAARRLSPVVLRVLVIAIGLSVAIRLSCESGRCQGRQDQLWECLSPRSCDSINRP